MKKVVYFLMSILLFITISGCNSIKKETSNNNEIKKETKKDKKSEDYKIEIKEKTKKIVDNISATYTSVIVTNSKKEKESDKINDYLAERVNVYLNEFEESLKEEYSKDLSYVFDFKYSLVEQNTKYIIFKLTYYYKIGGPYPVDATLYFMFDTSTGEIVKFDDLFSENSKKDIYDFVLKYLKKVYKESEIEYLDDDYDLEDGMFKEGYYLFSDGKLSFHFPRSEFTAAAFGSINIDINESVYSKYVKDDK